MSIRLKSIFGHGVDISHIPRVVSVYDRQGIRFLKKMMHEKEISQFESLHSQDRIKASQFIASRWSLKEAIIKATGSRLLFPEMYLVRDTSPMSTSIVPLSFECISQLLDLLLFLTLSLFFHRSRPSTFNDI